MLTVDELWIVVCEPEVISHQPSAGNREQGSGGARHLDIIGAGGRRDRRREAETSEGRGAGHSRGGATARDTRLFATTRLCPTCRRQIYLLVGAALIGHRSPPGQHASKYLRSGAATEIRACAVSAHGFSRKVFHASTMFTG